MKTQFALLARFGTPVIHLNDVSEEFFGMKIRTAQTKVLAGEFPIPTFRLSELKGAPHLIHLDDLASFIDEKLLDAHKAYNNINKNKNVEVY